MPGLHREHGAHSVIRPGANCILDGLIHATAFLGSWGTHRIWRVVCTREPVTPPVMVRTEDDVTCFHCIARGTEVEAYER